MTRRKAQSVASFGPELLALLIKGSTERREVRLPTPSDAIKLRHRLHILRSSMRAENHSEATLVERAKVSIDGSLLVVSPQDSEFADAIRASGMETPQLTDDPLAAFEAAPKGKDK